MKKLLVSALVAAGSLVANAADPVALTFDNAAGDRDLGNAANWNAARVLPQSPDYKATISTASTADSPLVMVGSSSVSSFDVTVSENSVFDLGKGNEFLAVNKFFFNSKKKLTLKSGILGIKWDTTSDGRFFCGDNSGGGLRVVVDGEDAVLTSSKKSYIQFGNNVPDCRLDVINGGTVRGHVSLGNTGAKGTDNVVWVEGPGSSHVVPSDCTAAALLLGRHGGWNTYALTNQATLKIETAQKIAMSTFYSTTAVDTPLPGNNKLLVLDHSFIDSLGSIVVGQDGGTNTFEASGGSTVKCLNFKISADRDVHMGTGFYVRDNRARITGAGTRLEVSGDAYIGQKLSERAEFRLEDGARLDVLGALSVGSDRTHNGLAYFGTNTVVEARRYIYAGNSANIDQTGNRAVFDACTLYMTNTFISSIFSAGGRGISNGVEIVNGAKAILASKGGYVKCGEGTYTTNSYLRVTGADTGMYIHDMNFREGQDASAAYSRVTVDGAEFRMEDNSSSREFYVGYNGNHNVFEAINGANVYLTNATFAVGVNFGATDNQLVVSNGAKLAVINFTSDNKHNLYVGNNGARRNGFLIDNATVLMTNEILRLDNDCWVKLRNGAEWAGYRVIQGEGAKSNSLIEVDNSRFIAQRGAIQVGVSGESYGHGFHIRGRNAYVSCKEGFSLCKDGELKFTVEKDGFANSPVLNAGGGFKHTNSDATDHPATVKIEVAEDNDNGGTFTLVKDSAGKIDWTNINLEYDPGRVRIVKQDDRELTVHVRRIGLILLLR